MSFGSVTCQIMWANIGLGFHDLPRKIATVKAAEQNFP